MPGCAQVLRCCALRNAFRSVAAFMCGERVVVRDQPRAALRRKIVPQPREGDDESVARADQEIDVRDAPEYPTDEAGDIEISEMHDGGPAADGREVAVVTIDE